MMGPPKRMVRGLPVELAKLCSMDSLLCDVFLLDLGSFSSDCHKQETHEDTQFQQDYEFDFTFLTLPKRSGSAIGVICYIY